MRVAVFRPKEHIEETAKVLQKEGFEVVAAPFLKTVVSEEGVEKLKKAEFEVAIITSQTAAKIAAKNIPLQGKRVIAIGKKTASVLSNAGVNSEMPSKFDSKSIVEEFAEKLRGKKVAILRSDKGDPVLLNLKNYAEVEEIVLYRIEEEHGKEQLEVLEKVARGELDAAIFSSRMMVHSFMKLADKAGMLKDVIGGLSKMHVIAIGPPTARALKEYDITPLMPEEYTFEGVMKLLRSLRAERGQQRKQ
ncbi:uroporphyrinogen-III synthase [Archaeoglobus veneficus]|uniref:uroporphyrinogen-III synthase n=1 Tax=Archaeoglobus veneficus TaxID=58290 RepID=UPI000A88F0AE|nr:uroporphyrinogen-III synthase [Archaeoglobus veneficus]